MNLTDDRAKTLAELRAALSPDDYAGVCVAAARLDTTLGGPAHYRDRTVLVAYGGGKDSAYMLAFVRALQLLLDEEHGTTFTMRVVTNRHAGMPHAVMANIDRSYLALRLYPDPDCRLLLVDGDDVCEFDVDLPLPAAVMAANRLDILMNGHRTSGDGRPTFCNSCNFTVANSFGLAASYDGGVDVIVTGDSPQEQRAYLAWIRRMARDLGQSPVRSAAGGFGAILSTVDKIGQVYFTDIHGPGPQTAARRVSTDVPAGLVFFSIYDDTAYASGDHWDILTGYLGFTFDEKAFNFTESDCANPALMAHLRALKAEHVYRRGYAGGLAEYVDFALDLMRRKEIPESLIELMRARYRGPEAVDRMRAMATSYARETFDLTDEQLVCLVHSPFTGNARGLADYLTHEQPELVVRAGDIHRLLRGEPGPADATWLTDRLHRLSGLTLAGLRVLYDRPRRPAHRPDQFATDRFTAGRGDVIGVILNGDPHKAVINTQWEPGGDAVQELISGR